MNPEPRPEPLYRRSPMIRASLGRSVEAIRLLASGTDRLVAPEDLRILWSCEPFRKLSDHARRISQTMPGGLGLDAIAGSLHEMAAWGGLITDRDVFASCLERQSAPEPHPGITRFALLTTSGRAPQLCAALTSYLDNFRTYERQVEIVVSDDAGDRASQADTQSACERLARQYGTRISYIGPPQKRSFAQWLVSASGVSPQLADFALFGTPYAAPAYGANRNAITLSTIGHLVFCADDDTLCDPAAAVQEEQPTPALNIAGDFDIAECWFVPDGIEISEHKVPKRLDVLGEHERVLGRTLACILRDFGRQGDTDIREMCPHILNSMCLGRGRIRVSYNGLHGDMGVEWNWGLPVHPMAGTRARIMQSQQAYREALAARHVVRHAAGPAIAHGGLSMGAFIGIDNRPILPPFVPVFRNEDGVFGAAMAHYFSDTYSAHLPFALRHAPGGPRKYNEHCLPPVRVSDILLGFMALWNPEHRPECPRERLKSAGRHLEMLGSLEGGEFMDAVRVALWRQAAVFIRRCEGLLRDQPRAPGFWRDDVARRVQQMQKAVIEPEYLIPRDLSPAYEPEQAPGILRNFIRDFGLLMQCWPAMVEAAPDYSWPPVAAAASGRS